MSEKPINSMNYKELRNEVQLLRDELARMKRTYEDLFYNLDNENFSSRIIKEKEGMKTEIAINAGEIKTKVSLDDVENYCSAELGITPGKIEMSTTEDKVTTHATFTVDGLRFFDGSSQAQGWAIEPDTDFVGGTLKYYVNMKFVDKAGNLTRDPDGVPKEDENGNALTASYVFGSGVVGSGYDGTDMVLKALNGQRGRFVVDVSDSGYSEVKFVGLNDNSSDQTSPRVFANEQLLATQNWVRNSARVVAKFA